MSARYFPNSNEFSRSSAKVRLCLPGYWVSFSSSAKDPAIYLFSQQYSKPIQRGDYGALKANDWLVLLGSTTANMLFLKLTKCP